MSTSNYYVNLDEAYKLKKLFVLGDNTFNNTNKSYYDIKYDNKFLYINFKADIYNLELIPRKKTFLQVDVNTINNFKKLIKFISTNIKTNILEYDSIYENKKSYILGFIPGYKKENKNTIFLKLNKYVDNQLNQVDINNLQEDDIPRNFHGIITLKVKALCKDTYNEEIKHKLVNDIHKITIINEIHENNNENENDELENDNLILKLINS